jgi:hypothetical protein
LQTTVEIVCRYLALERQKVKGIQNIKGKGALRSCRGRWEEAKPKQLDESRRSSRASAKPNVDGMNTRKIDDDEPALNRAGARTCQAVVTELGH